MKTTGRLKTVRTQALCVLSLLFVFISCTFVPVQAQPAAAFATTQAENRFPAGITFTVQLDLPGADVQSAEFVYKIATILPMEEDLSGTAVVASRNPVQLQYFWDGAEFPPAVQLSFHWVVTLMDGQTYQSDEEIYFYEDNQFEWTTYTVDQVTIYCHGRDKESCLKFFDVTSQALTRQTDFYASRYPLSFKILVYNDTDEIQKWHRDLSEDMGGITFPNFGVIAIYVPLRETRQSRDWVSDCFPHEISHLFFEWNTVNGFADAPVWLNEGSAVANELSDSDRKGYRALVQQMAVDGAVIPVSELDEAIRGSDVEIHGQAYAESYSLVSYILDTYGKSGYQRLLKAYKHARFDDYAFAYAFGVNQAEFEAGWRIWLQSQPAEPVEPPAGLKSALITLVLILAAALLLPLILGGGLLLLGGAVAVVVIVRKEL
jgi:hypothetical protein